MTTKNGKWDGVHHDISTLKYGIGTLARTAWQLLAAAPKRASILSNSSPGPMDAHLCFKRILSKHAHEASLDTANQTHNDDVAVFLGGD